MVSICIPTYNNVQSLERLLKSIENQTYRDFEVIICDDSIDDRIKETVKKYCQLPIQYHKNKVALGPTKNTNETIKLAKGSYIKVMHHDDCFGSAKSLETMVKALDENENADLFFCGTRETVYERDGKVNKEKTYERCISALEESQLKEDESKYPLGRYGTPEDIAYLAVYLLSDVSCWMTGTNVKISGGI